jgi:hypothetical protein
MADLKSFWAAQDVTVGELVAILDNPEFATRWWETIQRSFDRHLERPAAQPVTPWDWQVRSCPGGYQILGTCRAVRR